MLGCILVLLFVTGCTKAEPKKKPEKPRKVAVQKLEPTLIEDRITLPGEVEALKSVFLASESSGKVEWIRTRPDGSTIEGSDVAKGTELVKIDARLADAQLEQAKAGLELANTAYHVQAKLALEIAKQGLVQAGVAYELANAAYLRKAALLDMGSASPQDLDRVNGSLTLALAAYESAALGFLNAEAGYDVAGLRLVQAQSALTACELECEKSTVTTPFAGIVADIPIEIGDYLTPGKRVAHLIYIDRVKVIVPVPEGDIGRVSPGEPMLVRIPALKSLALNGSITRMPDAADKVTRTFAVEITIPNPGRLIKPGMIAKVDFVLGRDPEAIIVPINAILPTGEDFFVFVVDMENSGNNEKGIFHARQRKVVPGIMREDSFQITEGLIAGGLLIVKGQQKLVEGLTIEIIEGFNPGKTESSP